MKKTIIFGEPTLLPITKLTAEYLFTYSLVDSSLIGLPEQKSRSSQYSIKVGCTSTLAACWGFDWLQGNAISNQDFIKVLFEYGKRHIAQKLKDGHLSQEEELILNTSNTETTCPFDPSRIEAPLGAHIEVDLGGQQLMQEATFLQLASTIIDTRDNINALFHSIHQDKLIELREERDILQFFRDAASQEELFYRLCALANAATGFNTNILRRITGNANTEIKSIGLLENYLNGLNSPSSRIISTLRSINSMRQGYPVHNDRAKGVLEAHKYFDLQYPITDYSHSWRTLLLNYLDSLQSLLEIIKHSIGD